MKRLILILALWVSVVGVGQGVVVSPPFPLAPQSIYTTTGKNLLNPNNAIPNTTREGVEGIAISNVGYLDTGKVPIVPGDYTFSVSANEPEIYGRVFFQLFLYDQQGNYLGQNTAFPLSPQITAPGLTVGSVIYLSTLNCWYVNFNITNKKVGYVAITETESLLTVAQGTITSDSNGPSDGDTVTIGSQTYTFRNSPVTTGDVQIAPLDGSGNAQPALTLQNLNEAMVASPEGGYGSGVNWYATTTPNSQAHGIPINPTFALSGNAFTVFAFVNTTSGNSVVFTKSSSHLTLTGSGTLTGGGGMVPNSDFQRIASESQIEAVPTTNVLPTSFSAFTTSVKPINAWQAVHPLIYQAYLDTELNVKTTLGYNNPGPVHVIKSGDEVYAITPWSSTQEYVQGFNLFQQAQQYSINSANQPTYDSAWMIPASTLDSGVVSYLGSHTCNANQTSTGCQDFFSNLQDDITPIDFYSTYDGGNHGPSNVGFNANIPGHGKTSADNGSIWTDGNGNHWVQAYVVDANNIVYVSGDAPTSGWTYKVTPQLAGGATGPNVILTYDSADTAAPGATHTGSLTLATAGNATQTQLLPAINGQTLKMSLDGTRPIDPSINGDGIYIANTGLLISSNYYILDPTGANGMIAYLKAHIGTLHFNDPSVTRAFYVTQNFFFQSTGAVTVSTTVQALENITGFTSFYGTQIEPPESATSGFTHVYVPILGSTINNTNSSPNNSVISSSSGMPSGNSYNLSTYPVITPTPPDILYLYPQLWASAGNPPDTLTFGVADPTGKMQWGYTEGFYIAKGGGIPATRTLDTNLAIFMNPNFPAWKGYMYADSSSSTTYPTSLTAANTLSIIAIRYPNNYAAFPATTEPGTITTTGTAVVGNGTTFTTQVHVGDMINAGGQQKQVTVVTDNTHYTVTPAFSPDVSAASWTDGSWVDFGVFKVGSDWGLNIDFTGAWSGFIPASLIPQDAMDKSITAIYNPQGMTVDDYVEPMGIFVSTSGPGSLRLKIKLN